MSDLDLVPNFHSIDAMAAKKLPSITEGIPNTEHTVAARQLYTNILNIFIILKLNCK